MVKSEAQNQKTYNPIFVKFCSCMILNGLPAWFIRIHKDD